MDTYFILLHQCLHLDASGAVEPNNIKNKALLETSDLLVAAVTAIDTLPTKDTLFGNVSLLFEPIINVMANAQSTVIEPLAELRKTKDTQEVHHNALTLATALLQRSNHNFSHRFSYFTKGDRGVYPAGDYDPYPATEMANLGNFLKKTVNAKQNPSQAIELNQEIDRHNEKSHSTTSLYWEKLKNSLYILMEKVLGVHNERAPNSSHLDEEIKANKFISSLSIFSPAPNTKANNEKEPKDPKESNISPP